MDVQAVAAVATSKPQEAASPAASGEAAVSSAHAPDAVVAHADPGVLSPVLAKLMGPGNVPQPVTVNVSYRVEHDPNMIVTVFTDPNTGAEIAQVPAEVMIQIAQFFDKQSGVTLDRSV